MGSGVLFGQETKSINRVDAQTLQSAYSNGVISNAKDINSSNSKASKNRPHIVNSTSTNIPKDLSFGVREVFFYENGSLLIQITGIDTNNKPRVWYCTGTTSGDTFTISTWSAGDDYLVVFQNDNPGSDSNARIWVNNTTESSDGDISIPEVNDNIISKDDTWSSSKINEKFENCLSDGVIDGYLTTFQDTAPDESTNYRFWVNDTTTTEDDIMLPEINDNAVSSIDTWSSNKINSKFEDCLSGETIDSYLTAFQNTAPDETSKVRFWVNDTSTEEANDIMIPQVNDTATNAVDTWSSNKINSELSLTGLYAIFSSSIESETLDTIDTHPITIDNRIAKNGEDISSYMSYTDTGSVLLTPGVYLISGSITVKSTSSTNAFRIKWLSSKDNVTFDTSYESDNSENFMYLGFTNTSNAKISLVPTTLVVTENTYLQFNITPITENAEVIILPSKSTFQITKLK